jgi:8-oxo-dGTP pyrophosphatase MutT (NUDIX family)
MLRPIDIIDKNNHLTGKTSNPEDATNHGLWHRGAHAIIITPHGQVLVQRRSADAVLFPSMLDIGVGGFVDSGEAPEQTIIREVKEETGLTITKDQLVFLGTSKRTYRWQFKAKNKISRSIIYSYAVRLNHERNSVSAQKGEVDWVGFVPLKSALWLTHRGSLVQLGQLLPMYTFYRKAMRQTTRFIRIK